jgi:hypothetical protein
MTRLKKEKKVSSRKGKAKNHKVTLNALIVASQGIIPGIAIRN